MDTRPTLHVAFSALLAISGGCSASGTQELSDDKRSFIAVVTSEEWVFDLNARDTSEKNLDQCMERELTAGGVNVVSQTDFLTAAFPNLPPKIAPRSPEYLKLALTSDEVRKRLADLQVRYLLYVAGAREMPENWRDMTVYCQQTGEPIAVCVGGIEYKQTSWLEAALIDVEGLRIFDTLRADDTGLSWALVPVVPIPLWNVAETSDIACHELAEKVIKVISIEPAR